MKEKQHTFQLQKLLNKIQEHGYSGVQLYTYAGELKLFKLTSQLYRKQFYVVIPNTYLISVSNSDYILHEEEINYKSQRQRNYLHSIPLDKLVCTSNTNICIKTTNTYIIYELDDIQIDDDISEHSDISQHTHSTEDMSSVASSIDIDEYNVEQITPYILLPDFLEILNSYEQNTLLPIYQQLEEFEEQLNEQQVERLLDSFTQQQHIIKEQLFQHHKRLYNLKCDIKEHSDKLARLYTLKQESIHSKDRVRFKIDRLIVDIENTIDKLNINIQSEREYSDKLIQQYSIYINKFQTL